MSALPPLPGILADVERVAGRDAAIEMALAWGGQWIHIPAADYLARHPEHPVTLMFGARAKEIAEQIGGGIRVPLARRACVCHLAAAGLATRQISERLRLPPDTVRRYRRGA